MFTPLSHIQDKETILEPAILEGLSDTKIEFVTGEKQSPRKPKKRSARPLPADTTQTLPDVDTPTLPTYKQSQQQALERDGALPRRPASVSPTRRTPHTVDHVSRSVDRSERKQNVHQGPPVNETEAQRREEMEAAELRRCPRASVQADKVPPPSYNCYMEKSEPRGRTDAIIEATAATMPSGERIDRPSKAERSPKVDTPIKADIPTKTEPKRTELDTRVCELVRKFKVSKIGGDTSTEVPASESLGDDGRVNLGQHVQREQVESEVNGALSMHRDVYVNNVGESDVPAVNVKETRSLYNSIFQYYNINVLYKYINIYYLYVLEC